MLASCALSTAADGDIAGGVHHAVVDVRGPGHAHERIEIGDPPQRVGARIHGPRAEGRAGARPPTSRCSRRRRSARTMAGLPEDLHVLLRGPSVGSRNISGPWVSRPDEIVVSAREGLRSARVAVVEVGHRQQAAGPGLGGTAAKLAYWPESQKGTPPSSARALDPGGERERAREQGSRHAEPRRRRDDACEVVSPL